MRGSTRYPLQTVQAALEQLAGVADRDGQGHLSRSLTAAAAGIAAEISGSSSAPAPPHPAAPAVGAETTSEHVVQQEDTAAAVGHPDERMNVLSTPRLALWFELASTGLIAQSRGTINAGVGILTHHVGVAEIGQPVVVEARVVAAAGRAVSFACEATAGDRLIAFGVHQRVISDLPSAT